MKRSSLKKSVLIRVFLFSLVLVLFMSFCVNAFEISEETNNNEQTTLKTLIEKLMDFFKYFTGITGMATATQSGNVSLGIWDSVEGTAGDVDETVWFYTNYTNNSFHINGSTCNISFNDSSALMTESNDNYNYSRTFSSAGVYTWNVSCNKTGYVSLNVSDDVNITTSANNPPTQGTPILNSTFGTNLTSENLTVYNVSTSDADNDSIKNIIDWKKDGISVMVLNMPFEGGE